MSSLLKDQSMSKEEGMGTSPKHTPGPWLVPHMARDDHPCNCKSILAEGYMGAIATIQVDNGKSISEGGNDSPPLEEAKANAHLIAAAPDLLKTLQDFDAYASSGPWYDGSPFEAEVRAVIAKAMGENELSRGASVDATEGILEEELKRKLLVPDPASLPPDPSLQEGDRG